MDLNLPPVRKGRLKVGGVDGRSHGRLEPEGNHERCTCGWVSGPLGPDDDGPIVWSDHLVANGTLIPLEDVAVRLGSRTRPAG